MTTKFLIRMEIAVDMPTWRLEFGKDTALDIEDYVLNQIDQSSASYAGALKVTGFSMDEADA